MFVVMNLSRAHLHQASALGPIRARLLRVSESTLQQLCDDASNPVLIENNSVTQKWVSTHSGVTLFFSMRTVLLMSLQSCRSVHADAWCKRAFTWTTFVYELENNYVVEEATNI